MYLMFDVEATTFICYCLGFPFLGDQASEPTPLGPAKTKTKTRHQSFKLWRCSRHFVNLSVTMPPPLSCPVSQYDGWTAPHQDGSRTWDRPLARRTHTIPSRRAL